MITLMQNAAIQAGKILIENFKKNIEVVEKTNIHDLVTEVDKLAQQKVQEVITAGIKKRGIDENEIGFIGEEGLYKPAKFTFVIDPLDGTVNFSSGLNEFAVSIALFIDGVLEHGVMYHPIKNEILYASKGSKAFRILSGKKSKIKIFKTAPRDTMFCGSLSKDDEIRKKQINIYQKIYPYFRHFISINAFVPSVLIFLDHTNSVGVIFGGKTSIWDVAAAKIIVEEAGGVFTGWDGEDLDLELHSTQKNYPALVCHPDNLKLILDAMK